MTLIPIVLCGGAGSRLWPLSREHYPKPFLTLPDGNSFIQDTYQRALCLTSHAISVNHIITVGHQEYQHPIKHAYNTLDSLIPLPTHHVISESCARNTAPAVVFGCSYALQHSDPDAIVLVMPADHIIQDLTAFQQAVAAAYDLAFQNAIVTFGITPHYAETGYGYIEHEGTTVKGFTEKPTLKEAESYVNSQRFLWNSGMICCRAAVMIEQMSTLCPPLYQSAQKAYDTGIYTSPHDLLIDSCDVIADSIDYAVLEKTRAIQVIPCDIGWRDVGCFKSFGGLMPVDTQNNHISGDTLTHDTQNCTLISTDRLVTTVGLDNIVIVDTPDALLVAHKERTQDVKALVNELKLRHHPSVHAHKTVYRPWGNYTILEEGDHFKIKRIVVNPGGCLSLQMHHHRCEHWVVVSGIACVTRDGAVFYLNVNESTYIPQMVQHRLENKETTSLIIIEVQTGTYLGEDDIVRFEDIYGRQHHNSAKKSSHIS